MDKPLFVVGLVTIGIIMAKTIQSFTTDAGSNTTAFLRMIRELESGNDYNALVFGGRFSGVGHPRIKKTAVINGKNVTSTAAGAYQFIAPTYDWLRSVNAMRDMSPDSQDAGAIWLLRFTGALAFIESGDFSGAVGRANKTWASLPNSQYNQNPVSYERALGIYKKHGGRVA